MRRTNQGLFLLAVCLGVGGCASGARTRPEPVELSDQKSPVLATVLAVFPGIFVHGLGNLYAGKSERAEELMGEEGIGVGCLGLGGVLGYLGEQSHVHANHQHGAEMVFSRIEEASSFVGAAGVGGFGLVLFFDSWIRDIVEAPAAVEEKNRERRRLYDENNVTVPPDVTAEGPPAGAPGQARPRGRPAETFAVQGTTQALRRPRHDEDTTVPADATADISSAGPTGAEGPSKRRP